VQPGDAATAILNVAALKSEAAVTWWLQVQYELRHRRHLGEHPFSIPEDYNIRQISELARRSPFLLLSHPFACKVFDTINLLGASTTAGRLPQPLYRARILPHNAQALLSDFGPPPASKVMEGRYNHAGHPMLYLAESEATAIAEMGIRSLAGIRRSLSSRRSSRICIKSVAFSSTRST
jgi:RES domain